MLQRIWAVWIARNKEFYRDRGALTWTLLLPLLIVAGFGYAFGGQPKALYKVAVFPKSALTSRNPFFTTQYVEFVGVDELKPEIEKVERHQIDLLIALDDSAPRYWINSSSPKGYIVERILKGSVPDAARYQRQSVDGREVRYVDWLIPGLLSMNMMFSALFGVGYVIVRYRKNGTLKRLKATPLRPFEFLFAQLASRATVILFSTTTTFLGCRCLVHFPIVGSPLSLLVVLILGASCMISLSLIIAARFRSEEMAGGLLNVISWPMMFLSGVWFSLEGAHRWVQRVANCLPLTHIINPARAILLDGASLWSVRGDLAILAAMTAVFLTLGSALFIWE